MRFWLDGGGGRMVAVTRIRELLVLVRRDGRGWGWSCSGICVWEWGFGGWMDGWSGGFVGETKRFADKDGRTR